MTTTVTGTQFDDRIVVPGGGFGDPGFFQGANFTARPENAASNGPDSILGDNGQDTIIAAGGDDTVLGENGNDSIVGGDGNDLINGQNGPDDLEGSNGNDTLIGENGPDTMFGATGNDLLTAGNGPARADYLFAQNQYWIYETESDQLVVFGGEAGSYEGVDTLEGVTTLRFNGVDVAASSLTTETLFPIDGLDSVGSGGSNFIAGSLEDDLLSGQAGNDTIIGLNGDDVLLGGDGIDLLVGDLGFGDGNNSLSGGAGVDVLFGGDISDTLVGGAGNDILIGLDGEDLLAGEEDTDVLFGGDDNDGLLGQGGDDVLVGEDGSDEMDAGEGNDRVHIDPLDALAVGGGGILDVIVIQDNSGQVMTFNLGAAGNQNASGFGPTVTGFEAIDAIASQTGINASGSVLNGNGNILFGSTFNDTLTGSDAADIIVGAPGADVMAGGNGDDTIGLDTGNDTATGGLGDDTFGYFGFGGAGAVAITDFTPEDDTIHLPQTLGLTPEGALAATTQVGADAVFTASAGKTITLIGVDVDDLTSADFSILSGF